MKNTLMIIIGAIVLVLIIVFAFPGNDNQLQTTNTTPDTTVDGSDSSADNTKPDIQEEKFDKVPDFSLKDYEGNAVSLSDFEGKTLVLNSWAVWCPFCVDELPDFGALQKEFGDQIVVIAIDRSESLSKAKGFTDKLGISNDLIFLLDPGDSFYRSIGGFSMPETLFVDGNGNIRVHKRGPMELSEMRDKVNSILNS